MYQVYVWTHKKSGKRYVGSTKQETVFKRAAYGDGYRGSPVFYKAIQEDGLDAFDVEIVATTEALERAHELEEHYIELYKTRDPEYGYNVFHSGYPTVETITAERNAKISDTLKKQRGSEEYRGIMQKRMQKVWDDPEKREALMAKRTRTNRPGGLPRIKVRIVELDKVFDNKLAATEFLGLSHSSLSRMTGDRKVCRSKIDGKRYTVEIVTE